MKYFASGKIFKLPEKQGLSRQTLRTMLKINKNSHLVTVLADFKLSELKKELIREGLYLGYHPLDDINLPLHDYLVRRTPNLYHFKYGSISDLTSSLLVKLGEDKSFHLKDSPRPIQGPDFNKVMIGSGELLGKIKTVTLKIISIPEHVVHGLVLVHSRDCAKKIIAHMQGTFIQPLYFRFFGLGDAETILDQLKIKTKPTEALLFCLSGLREMVTVFQEVMDEFCASQHYQMNWLAKKHEHEIIHTRIHNPESYKEILEQYRHFLWRASDETAQSKWEKHFTNYMSFYN
ncbi:MAG: FAD-binding oxidoreductase [Deltaproteobacteria bacterium]|nr:FAD-binding oxidoreductase [Deltaproteobacteria bacterium]